MSICLSMCPSLLEHLLFLFYRTYQLLKDKLSCSTVHFIRSENNQTKLPYKGSFVWLFSDLINCPYRAVLVVLRPDEVLSRT